MVILRLRSLYGNTSKIKSWDSDSSSCFVSSSDDENTNLANDPNSRNFIPLYRKEHGGIVIYDADGNIPGQPPPQSEESDTDEEGKILTLFYLK